MSHLLSKSVVRPFLFYSTSITVAKNVLGQYCRFRLALILILTPPGYPFEVVFSECTV
jgi:hypothetical protein